MEDLEHSVGTVVVATPQAVGKLHSERSRTPFARAWSQDQGFHDF